MCLKSRIEIKKFKSDIVMFTMSKQLFKVNSHQIDNCRHLKINSTFMSWDFLGVKPFKYENQLFNKLKNFDCLFSTIPS